MLSTMCPVCQLHIVPQTLFSVLIWVIYIVHKLLFCVLIGLFILSHKLHFVYCLQAKEQDLVMPAHKVETGDDFVGGYVLDPIRG